MLIKILFLNLFKILNIKKLQINDLGYKIAPLLNSAGRLENANKIVEMLTTKSKTNITKIISKIYNLNNQRKLIEKRILDKFDFESIYNQKEL